MNNNKYWLLPTLAVGLFGGRLISEWLRPGLIPAILITLTTLAITNQLFKKHITPNLTKQWPLLWLLGYILYPHPNPHIALAAVTLVLLSWVLKSTTHHPPPTTHHLFIPALITLTFLALYIATLAPGVLPADNGEFQLIATNLGVAHPPGFPLYTLLGHLMTQLPLPVSAAYKVNLLSALTSSLTLGIVYLSVQKIVRSVPAGLITTITLGTATTYWAQATTANIRSLTALFAALAFYLLLGIGDRGSGLGEHNTHRPPSTVHRRYTALALVLTLGLTHHLSLAFMTLIFGVYILWQDWHYVKQPRHWPRPGLTILLSLLPLLYLPLRATSGARGTSPHLATLPGFLNHTLALGFRGDFFHFIEPTLLWERLKVMGNVMTFQFHPLLLIGMALGLLWLLRHNRKTALLLGGTFLIHTLITATYRAPQTVEYMLPAYIPAAICLGAVAGGRWRLAVDRWPLAGGRWPLAVGRWPLAASRQPLIALLLTIALAQGLSHWQSFRYLHHSTDTQDYAQTLLDNAPAGSTILADWHWATPLWYLQEVDNLRPDLNIHFVFPDADPYGLTWAKRIQTELDTGRAVIATHYDPTTYHTLPPPYPIGQAFLFTHTPLASLPAGYTPTNLTLNNTHHILGYQLSQTTLPTTYQTTLTIAWQPTETCQPEPENCESSLYSHLIGFDGGLYAQDDVTARAQPHGLTLTQFRLTPRPGATPGDYALLLGTNQDRQPLTTLTVTPRPDRPTTQHPTYRPLINENKTLIGYDWDNTLPDQTRLYLHYHTPAGYQTQTHDLPPNTNTHPLPPHYSAWGIPINNFQFPISNSQFYIPLAHGLTWLGATPLPTPPSPTPNLQSPISNPPISQTLTSSRPLQRDLTLSLRLIGYEPDNYHWAWTDQDDTIPAMGGIPTLKWIANSHIHTPHFVTLDTTAQPGQTIGGLIQLYDAFTTRPVPILDERITQNHLGIPLPTASR